MRLSTFAPLALASLVLICPPPTDSAMKAQGRNSLGDEHRPDVALTAYFRAPMKYDPNYNANYEYGSLERWSVGGGPSPWEFDGVVRVTNAGEVNAKNIAVQIQLRFKVGDFVRDPEMEMTDYRRGYRTARWQPWEYQRTLQIEDLGVAESQFHIVKIDLEKVLKRLGPDLWPWFVELSAEASSVTTESRTENNKTFALLELQAGD